MTPAQLTASLIAAVCIMHNICNPDPKTNTCSPDPCVCQVCYGGTFRDDPNMDPAQSRGPVINSAFPADPHPAP